MTVLTPVVVGLKYLPLLPAAGTCNLLRCHLCAAHYAYHTDYIYTYHDLTVMVVTIMVTIDRWCRVLDNLWW